MLEVNDSNFEAEVLNSPVPVLVDFWADWCVPCKQMMPVIEGIEQTRTDLKFVKFLSNRDSVVVQKYGIRSVPTLMLFSKGSVCATKSGSSTKEQIEKLIDSGIGLMV